VVSPAITGLVSGRFNNVEVIEFLNGLRAAFGAQWYAMDGTLYFFHDSEWVKRVFYPQTASPERLLIELKGSTAISDNLPVKLSDGALIIEGPKNYVQQVVAEAQNLDSHRPVPRLKARVFKLKYAQADDLTITGTDRSVTIPGVATILRAMLSGSKDSLGASNSQVRENKASMEGLMGRGLSAKGADTNPSQASTSQVDGMANGNVIADPRVNAVLVYDLDERMPFYESVIAELDRETHLVEIHAAIVDINSTFRRELGITLQGAGSAGDNWNYGGEQSQSDAPYNVLPIAGAPGGEGTVFSTVYSHGANFFVARVQALEKDGRARLLGRPTVLTMDNQEATLENTTTYYIEVAGNEAVDLFKVDSGTVLRVTPHIIDSGDTLPAVRLSVSVQDDQDSTTSASSMSGTKMAIPPIKQTKLNTQAIIETGQSLLIGGYYFERNSNDVQGTPILKDIPLLGRLFKNKTKDTAQMERMVLITPRIVRLGEIQRLPSHLDDKDMSRSPTQTNYEPRASRYKAGCGSVP
jgi:type III secretion protein C